MEEKKPQLPTETQQLSDQEQRHDLLRWQGGVALRLKRLEAAVAVIEAGRSKETK